MADPVSLVPVPAPLPCAICGRPATAKFRPFCSVRCADADLGRWLTGTYRVPGPPADEDTDPARLDPEEGMR